MFSSLLGMVLSVLFVIPLYGYITVVAWLLPTLIHVHANVPCLILPLFYSICSNAVQHTLYNVALLYCSVANIGHADVMWCIIILLTQSAFAICFCSQYHCCMIFSL